MGNRDKATTKAIFTVLASDPDVKSITGAVRLSEKIYDALAKIDKEKAEDLPNW